MWQVVLTLTFIIAYGFMQFFMYANGKDLNQTMAHN